MNQNTSASCTTIVPVGTRMETKQSARELLKEVGDLLATVQYYFPSEEEASHGTPDYLAIADVDACQKIFGKIDAYLAAPSESAMAMVRKIREGGLWLEPRGGIGSGAITDTDAAALIEGLQRRVPRKMLREIWLHKYEFTNAFTLDEILGIIAKEHGVVIE